MSAAVPPIRLCTRCGVAPRWSSHVQTKYCAPCSEAARSEQKHRQAGYRAAWRDRTDRRGRDNAQQRGLWTLRYGLTEEQYDAKLAEQGGACAICRKPAGTEIRRFHVDHDHSCCPYSRAFRTCGKCTRGILCNTCNARVVAVLEGPYVEAGMAYLRSYAK